MSGIHYKFKSTLDYDKVIFDGTQLSVADLKRLIMEKNKIGSQYFDLQITNAQTGEVYKDPMTAILRNTSVNVARVPLETPERRKTQKIWDTRNEGAVDRTKRAANRDGVASLVSGQNNLSLARNADMSEEDKLSIVMHESAADYDPSNYKKSRQMTGTPHPSYICQRCNQPGHWVNQCPKGDLKRSTGIPKEDLVPTDANDPQAMVTSAGLYVVPRMHRDAKRAGKTERHPFLQEDEIDVRPNAVYVEIPLELKCKICGDLMRDAVLIPCCGFSFCDDCIRSKLLESDEHECPHCGTCGQSPDSLVANSQLRLAVQNFQNETGSEVMSTGILRPPPSVMAVFESSKLKNPKQEPILRVNLAKQHQQAAIVAPHPQPSLIMSLPGPPVIPEPNKTQPTAASQGKVDAKPSGGGQSASSVSVPTSGPLRPLGAPGVTPPPQVAIVTPMSHSMSTSNLQASASFAVASASQPPPPGLGSIAPTVAIPRPLTEREFYEKKYKLQLQDQCLSQSELERKFEKLLERRRRHDSSSSSSTDSSADSTGSDSFTSSEASRHQHASRRRSPRSSRAGGSGSGSRPRAYHRDRESRSDHRGFDSQTRRKRHRSSSYTRGSSSRRRRSNSRARRRSRSRSDPSRMGYTSSFHTGPPHRGHFYSSAMPGPIIPPLQSQTTTFYGPPIVPFSSAPYGHPGPPPGSFGFGYPPPHHEPQSVNVPVPHRFASPPPSSKGGPHGARWQVPSMPLSRTPPVRTRRRSGSPSTSHTHHRSRHPQPKTPSPSSRSRHEQKGAEKQPVDSKHANPKSKPKKEKGDSPSRPTASRKEDVNTKKKSKKEERPSERKKEKKAKKESKRESKDVAPVVELEADKTPSPPKPISVIVQGVSKRSTVVVPVKRSDSNPQLQPVVITDISDKEEVKKMEITKPTEIEEPPVVDHLTNGQSEVEAVAEQKSTKTEISTHGNVSDCKIEIGPQITADEDVPATDSKIAEVESIIETQQPLETPKEKPAASDDPAEVVTKPPVESAEPQPGPAKVQNKGESGGAPRKRLTHDDSLDHLVIPLDHELAEEQFIESDDTENKASKTADKPVKKHHKKEKKHKEHHHKKKPKRTHHKSSHKEPSDKSLPSTDKFRRPASSLRVRGEPRTLLTFDAAPRRSIESENVADGYQERCYVPVSARFQAIHAVGTDSEDESPRKPRKRASSSRISSVFPKLPGVVAERLGPIGGSVSPADPGSMVVSVSASGGGRGAGTPTQRVVAVDTSKRRDSRTLSSSTAGAPSAGKKKKHRKDKKHHKGEKHLKTERRPEQLMLEGPNLPAATEPLVVQVSDNRKPQANPRDEKVVITSSPTEDGALDREKPSPTGSRNFHTSQAMEEVAALSAAAGSGRPKTSPGSGASPPFGERTKPDLPEEHRKSSLQEERRKKVSPPPEKVVKKKRSPIKAPSPDDSSKKSADPLEDPKVMARAHAGSRKRPTSPVVRGRGKQMFRSRDYTTPSDSDGGEDDPASPVKRGRRNVCVRSSPISFGPGNKFVPTGTVDQGKKKDFVKLTRTVNYSSGDDESRRRKRKRE